MENYNNNYSAWLHQVTTLGYERGITISHQDSSAMEQYYELHNTPEQAIEMYEKYLERKADEATHKITAEQLRDFIIAARAMRVQQNAYFRHQSNLNLQKAKKVEAPVDEFIRMCE